MHLKELQMLQKLPLEIKILKTKKRIMEAIDRFGYEGVYLSFSGGKDSLVLHYILLELEREMNFPISIPRVFCDTGLEYPDVKANALSISDVILKPQLTFLQVIVQYGYPVVSKEQSQYIYQYRNTKSEKLKKIRLNGNRWDMGKISNKWKYLINCDFTISDKCCEVMKKRPFKKFEKQTGRIPILAILACESFARRSDYIKNNGCNAFEGSRPKSSPLSFWTEQDILQYIYIHNIKLPSIYGQLIKEEYSKDMFTKEVIYYLTGVQRTGCIFCMYGIGYAIHQEKFLKLKEHYPDLYEYCMRGGKYDEKGMWVPYQGLGLKHVLEFLKVNIKELE